MIVKWQSKYCRQQKQVSLFASGLLPQFEAAPLKAHLQTCEQCLRYHQELIDLSQNMARLKGSVSRVVPGANLNARWTKQVLEGSKSAKDGVRATWTLDLARQWFFLPR